MILIENRQSKYFWLRIMILAKDYTRICLKALKKNFAVKGEERWKTMKNGEKQWKTMKNGEQFWKTMKTGEKTVKNSKKRWKMMKNCEKRWKTVKNSKNGEKWWKQWKMAKNSEKTQFFQFLTPENDFSGKTCI